MNRLSTSLQNVAGSGASRRALLAGVGATALLAAAGCSSSSTASSGESQQQGNEGGERPEASVSLPAGISSVTAFVKSEKSVGVAVEYKLAIDTSKLTTTTFTATDRTITKVYANTSAALADSGTNGQFVIVEWTPVAVSTGRGSGMPSGGASGGPRGGASGVPQADASGMPGGGIPSGGGDNGGGMPSGMPSGDASRGSGNRGGGISVVQAGAVTATDGTVYAASTTKLRSTTEKTLS